MRSLSPPLFSGPRPQDPEHPLLHGGVRIFTVVHILSIHLLMIVHSPDKRSVGPINIPKTRVDGTWLGAKKRPDNHVWPHPG